MPILYRKLVNLFMANNSANYTNIGDIKDYWLKNIAPNYFDFEDVNTYGTGIFGYINEVMGTTTEDAFNATNLARREFYPITAQYLSSLYKMATLQSIEIPLTVPAQCKCALIIPQDQIIENSTYSNGVYNCTIDSCLKIYADNLQYMLDYPINIISKKTDKWVHTTHYDINVNNSLSTNTRKRYLSNQIIHEHNTNYVAIFVDTIRQVEMQQVSKVLIRDNILATTVMDVDFDGKLANFEVFYIENGNDKEVQLKKVMINSATPTVPFVFYEMINENKIRLTFKYNSVFVPKYNSEIICRIYTSQGSAGNFKKFDGDLICSSDSEKYPYNSNMTIVGKINGESYGGKDVLSIDDLRNKVIRAYSTNSTITTSSDLQLAFDQVSDNLDGVKVLFKKKRDDVFTRLFGAYALMKDEGENILPTNTLNVECERANIMSLDSTDQNRIMIKPGTIYKYKSEDSFVANIALDEDGNPLNIMNIDPDSTEFLFTNPFLIGININPNIVGYYLNTVNSNYSIDYTYVNDNSPVQFISSGIMMERNAILGQDYYKLTVKLTPSIDGMEYDSNVTPADTEAADYAIRAKYNGRIESMTYYTDPNTSESYIRAKILYDTDNEDEKVQYIQASTILGFDQPSKPGYEMKYNVGEEFIANDILAVKMPTDKNNLKVVADLDYSLYTNGYYVPFTIEKFDEANNIYYFSAYLGTTDEIDLDSKIIINHGVYNKNNVENTFLPLKMKDFMIEVCVLYNNDGQNQPHKYSDFAGLNEYTYTNSYTTTSDSLGYFVEDLQFIRSTIDYYPGDSENNWKVTISEVPMVQATWAIDNTRFMNFIDQYKSLDGIMQDVHYSLENNFSIDTKFYNTYGKARFYSVGNTADYMVNLDNVKISMRFGIKLNVQYNQDTFIPKFREYVKNYIENSDSIGSTSQDIFILNLIADAKANFSDIAYIEYYGFNIYNHMAQKIVGPSLEDYIDEFIPEFVNIKTAYTADGVAYPDISVTILQD